MSIAVPKACLTKLDWTPQEDAFLVQEGLKKDKTWPEIAKILSKPEILCYRRFSFLRKNDKTHKCPSFFTTKQKDSLKKYFLEKFLPEPDLYPALDVRQLFPICDGCYLLFKKEMRLLALDFYKGKEKKEGSVKSKDETDLCSELN